MAFQLGKSDIKTITGKVDIFTPQDFGGRSKAGSLKVTVQVLPRSEFLDMTRMAENDAELVKRLVLDIGAGDSKTEVAPYTEDLVDEIYEIDWQFDPILTFVLQANSGRIGRALKAKN